MFRPQLYPNCYDPSSCSMIPAYIYIYLDAGNKERKEKKQSMLLQERERVDNQDELRLAS